jgi:DNA-binding XRE family transcriptional regulator
MEKLIRLRIIRDLTQEELADMAKISENTLNLIEQGKSDPKLSTLRKIVKALDIRFDCILS